MKNRLLIAVIAIIIALFVLASCGNKEATEGTTAEITTADASADVNATEADKEETTAVQQENGMYDAEIAMLKGLFDGSTELFSDGTAGVSELINMHGAEKASVLTGYAVTDIGGDGIPEFVVGVIDEENKGSQLLAVFTRDEDSSVTVIEGMTKNAYFLLNDNSIFNQGTDGAATSFFAHFTFSENGRELLCKDFWFTAADSSNPYELIFFHNTTGETDVTSSERLDVGEEEFFGKQGNFLSEKKQITLTPFKSK